MMLAVTWAITGGDNYVESPDCGEFIGDPPDCNFR